MESEKEKIRLISKELIDEILSKKITTSKRLDYRKRKLSKSHDLVRILRNSEILEHTKKDEFKKVQILIKKPVRSISGISIVAVMAKPAPCPGKCIYCAETENSPKSYTGLEPAARRAKRNDFDPYKQTANRTKQLQVIGHSIDKIELIIMGGTFLSLSTEYQEWFVKRCFDALNGKDSETLPLAQKMNETAKSRCVGLTIETRPDYCKNKHINQMLKLGATRVELGVQTLSDDIYLKINRGHTIKDVIDVTKNLKDSAFKIVYHMMPGLFHDNKEDIKMFKELFDNPDFRPDMLKIYPVLVIKDTKLYDLYKNGKYNPLTNDSAKVLIADVMAEIPRYVRIMRCQRDIPMEKIVAGPTAGNLRDMAEKHMTLNGKECDCIRCHEAGHLYYKKGLLPHNLEIDTLKYEASGGTEYFITLEDKKQKIIVGFLRLRIASQDAFRKEINEKTALVRELKVFGTSMELDDNIRDSFQHKGVGKQLMNKAENIAKGVGAKKILVISAIGTREYYRKLGYINDGPYISKKI